ncbi:MAG: hypothetical protein QM642_02015 [Edaphocola sp.]
MKMRHFCLALVSIPLYIGCGNSQNTVKEGTPSTSEVFAKEVFSEFKENEVAAKQKYGEKVFTIKGTIAAIEAEGDESKVLVNDGDPENIGIKCYFYKDQQESVQALKKGEMVRVIGVGDAGLYIDYSMYGCRVVPLKPVPKPSVPFEVIDKDRSKRDLSFRVKIDSTLTGKDLFAIAAYLRVEEKWLENYACFFYKSSNSNISSGMDVGVYYTPRVEADNPTFVGGEPYTITYASYTKR